MEREHLQKCECLSKSTGSSGIVDSGSSGDVETSISLRILPVA